MPQIDSAQLISLVGALFILAAYAANQIGLVTTDRPAYSVANLVGALILVWVAVVGAQYGFLVLEASWAAISIAALVRHRRKERGIRRNEESSTP